MCEVESKGDFPQIERNTAGEECLNPGQMEEGVEQEDSTEGGVEAEVFWVGPGYGSRGREVGFWDESGEVVPAWGVERVA